MVRDPKFELGEVRAVQNWVAENVRVITQANELTLSDFSYNSEGYIAVNFLFRLMARR